MLDTLGFLSAFAIVKAVKRAHEIACDTADALKGDAFFGTPALGASVADDAVKTAHRVAVDRMVDRTITHAAFLHVADDGLEGFDVFRRVAVEFDIADVPGIGERVVGRLKLNLAKGIDAKVNRDMEAVGVILAVGHVLDLAKADAVDVDETSGKPFGRCGQQRKVKLHLG